MIPKNQIDQTLQFLKQIKDGTPESYRKLAPDLYLLSEVLNTAPLSPQERIVCLYLAGEEYQCETTFERKFVANKEQYAQMTLRQLMDENLKSDQVTVTNTFAGRAIIQANTEQALKNVGRVYAIDFLRPLPIQIECAYQWEIPFSMDVMWDWNIQVSQDPIVRIKEILVKGKSGKLTPKEAQETIDLLNQEKKYVVESGITPQLLVSLIEYNPDLSSYLLARINQCDMSIHEYFECLINMKISLQSLEVVNKLSNSIKLPEAFLHMYVTRCIEYCEQIKTKQSMVSRYVRLVAVFIKTLIRSKTLDPKNIFMELQGFCIEFSNIPEASTLFKQLKDTPMDKEDQRQQLQHQ